MRKYIAICGQPGHGKSTVQSILSLIFDVEPIDDGLPIRKMAIDRWEGVLSWEDVTTEAGKSRLVHWTDDQGILQTETVRQILGNIGKEYEDNDPCFWAREAIKLAEQGDSNTPASFGSVRGTQPNVYAAAGGIVLEVFDPRKPMSKNDFDQYDTSAVTHFILNNGSKLDLVRKAAEAVSDYLHIS